jgi:acid phosphatase
MENHSYGDIIGNTSQAPYINSVASECGLATNYRNLSHPSLPNYIGATSGLSGRQLKTFNSDCNPSKHCSTPAPSIFGQGETWKAYEESMPSNCAPANSGEYAVRHNPPPYYTTLTGCATLDVPYPQLSADLAGNTLPAFSFVTPNLIDDMHDGTIAQGDTWLSQNVPAILNSPAFTTQNSLLLITWDEDDGTQNNQVPMLVINKAVPAGFRSGIHYDHYSLLKTVESAWGLSALTANDANAIPMSDFFGSSSATLPGAPTGATAVADRKASATVSWTAPANNGGCSILSYTATSSPGGLSATVNGTTTSAKITGLTVGTSYTFTVAATNCVGTGPASAPSNSITARK